jgi:hypothetical protein
MASTTNRPPELIGVADDTLRLWLTQAQQAIQDLTTGGKVQSASYAQNAGSKAVAYTRADLPALYRRVQTLSQALGLVERRRPMRPYFG